ncbi:MAG: DUF1553 domain-containing protein, partial [Gemmataceae bacterium]|nr:DUF1553 domain-containing protein [Gemmataceae bacterium]
AAMSFSVFFWILGHFSGEIRFVAEKSGNSFLRAALLAFSRAAPDFAHFNYRDAWHELPDFVPLKPVQEGKLAGGRFTLAAAPSTEAMALVFEGRLKVPAEGEHAFDLTASDGARLVIDGKRVIDQPGKGRSRTVAKARLKAGSLPIRLEYFNTTTKAELSLAWSGPGFAPRMLTEGERVLVPDARKGGTEWRYRTMWTGKWKLPDLDDKEWKVGKSGFGTVGTPGAVVGTTWGNNLVFLRKEFTLDRLPASLAMDLHHDDHVEVALNGKTVFAERGYLTDYKRVPLDASALRIGRNVLAVRCTQTGGGQFIDVGLVGLGNDHEAILRKHGSPEKLKALDAARAELAALRAEKKPPATLDIMCVAERGKATTRVLARGNPHAPTEAVEAGTPEVLGPSPKKAGRAALAEWIMGSPIAARAMANRVWQYHFGRGIAPTSNDFGKLGEAPTHPELLDWLACELAEGWDLKRLHRAILLSSAYRMSSKGDPSALAKDGANNLFWRFPMRRLQAEEMRDSILAASGELRRRMAGPSVYPPIPKAVLAGQSVPGSGWGKSPVEEASRRSVYVHVKRSLLVPILETHDAADTDSSCAVRFTTTVPTQALGMLNGEFTNEQAGRFADRLIREGRSLAEQVARAVRLTTGRVPGEAEIAKDAAFVERLSKEEGFDARKALAAYCLLALNSNEFAYLD